MDFRIKHPKTLTDRELLEQLYDMVIVLHDKIDKIDGTINNEVWVKNGSTPHDTISDIESNVFRLRDEYKAFDLDK